MSATVKLLQLENELGTTIRQVIADCNLLDKQLRDKDRQLEDNHRRAEAIIAAREKQIQRLQERIRLFDGFFGSVERYDFQRDQEYPDFQRDQEYPDFQRDQEYPDFQRDQEYPVFRLRVELQTSSSGKASAWLSELDEGVRRNRKIRSSL